MGGLRRGGRGRHQQRLRLVAEAPSQILQTEWLQRRAESTTGVQAGRLLDEIHDPGVGSDRPGASMAVEQRDAHRPSQVNRALLSCDCRRGTGRLEQGWLAHLAILVGSGVGQEDEQCVNAERGVEAGALAGEERRRARCPTGSNKCLSDRDVPHCHPRHAEAEVRHDPDQRRGLQDGFQARQRASRLVELWRH